MSVIELQNVCKSYKDGERVNHVLKNINLRVEICCLDLYWQP